LYGDNINSPSLLCSNVALSACAFNTSSYGDEVGFPRHFAQGVNDGIYGNDNSWLGGPSDPAPAIILKFSGAVDITAIAFGRDNSNPANTDRSVGTYNVSVAIENNPDPFNTNYTLIATIQITALTGSAGFITRARHLYPLSSEGCGTIYATALRIETDVGLLIDELEVYGIAVPA